MLDELIVSNLGLIGHVRLQPGPGMVVVTGETGTGKTLLIGALRLLLGGSARKDLIGPLGAEATVQARFVTGDGELAVARRITEGRSRAYLDGFVASVKAIESSMAGVVELIGQHDHLQLTRPGEVRIMLDGALDAEGQRILVTYDRAWQHLASLQQRQAALGGDPRSIERELDTARRDAEEIAAAGFVAGDDHRLGTQASRLRNANELVELLDAAATALGDDEGGATLDAAVSALERAGRLDGQLAELSTQATELTDLTSELRRNIATAASEIENDPAQLEAIEQRLAVLNDLRRRYGDDLDAVLAFESDARRRADELFTLLNDAANLDDEIARAGTAVHHAGAELAEARSGAGKRLGDATVVHLRDLGFRQPVVRFEVETASPGPHGADRCQMLFSSDVALSPGPVSRIASGGELSRLVLALRLAAGAGDASVAAFDEVDAGVGGTVARELGRKLAGLARHRQVLAVTHLPQVAAYADHHFVVRREGTETTVEAVEGDDRIEELSRMLAGLPDSDRGRGHAEELVAMARDEKEGSR